MPLFQTLSVFADTPSWLSAEPVRVAKTGDLPANAVPYSKGLDCNEKTLLDPVYKYTLTNCSVSTGAGTVVSGKYTDGVHPIGSVFSSFLQSYGDSQLVYMSDSRKTLLYPAVTKAQLVFNNSANLPGYNYVPSGAYTFLTSVSKAPIYLDIYNMAYSNNGQWLVANVMASPTSGLMVFDTKTYTGKFIAPLSTYTTLFSGNDTPGSSNLAISDDGRYVAAGYTQPNKDLKEKGLRIYDTTTCTDQYDVPSASRVYCSYKNVWTGKLGGTTKTSAGIQEQLPQVVERPLNVRFKDAGTITFSGVYDYSTTSGTMKAATYEATMLPAPPPPIKLLALGDSYISGEGAYSYISGTDTSNNKCHQSSLSYPYLLGAQYAAEYHSVACSGAVMANIYSGENLRYLNQLIDNKPQRSYGTTEIQTILNEYRSGTIEQYQFINKDKPNVILLSIGGNDISFADIVKRCVVSFAWDPCYHKQSERKSLLLTIYSKFTALKATYSKILSEAPDARLYVMGYPQVVNPTGSCGVNVHFDDSERQFASLLIDRLNDTVKAAAESSGAVYVDVSNALVGHRLCDSHDDGVNGLTSGDDSFSIGAWLGTNNLTLGLGKESYHPTALGHQLISNAIAQQTENLTKQPVGAINILLPKIRDGDEFITTGAIDDAPVRRIEQQDIVDKNIVTGGEKVTLNLDASTTDIKPGSAYQVVFHSDEVAVANGTLPNSAELRLDITVPKLTPGMHSVHIYTTDVNGENVDVAEDIYVVASSDDVDGDGIVNSEDPLPFINETDHVIVPEEPAGGNDTPDNNTNNQGSADNQDPPASISQDTVNPVISKTDAQQNRITTTDEATKVELESPDVVIANPSTLPKDSQGLSEVLGASDTKTSVLERKSKDAKSSKDTSSNGIKPMIVLWFSIAVIAVAAVFAFKHKRSKKQSGRI